MGRLYGKVNSVKDGEWIRTVTYFTQKHEFECLLLWPFQYFITYERFDNKNRGIDFQNAQSHTVLSGK